MIDLQDKEHCPSFEELTEYIRNPVFRIFSQKIRTDYNCREKIEYSSCSLEKGWNIKFRKSGRTLCTIYPRESYFTVMLVVGRKEKEPFETILPDCNVTLQEIYRQTKEGNGQRWLMVELEDEDEMYRDVFRFLEIRAKR